MKTHVEFRSGQFPPCDNEDAVVNPGRYGKRLAEFLVQGLRSEGFEVHASLSQDWGWVVKLENKKFPLWVGCGNYEEYADGFLCFIEPHKPVIRRFLRRIDTTKEIGSFQQAIDRILRGHPGVRDIRSWTH